jgi:hypothetical protein
LVGYEFLDREALLEALRFILEGIEKLSEIRFFSLGWRGSSDRFQPVERKLSEEQLNAKSLY